MDWGQEFGARERLVDVPRKGEFRGGDSSRAKGNADLCVLMEQFREGIARNRRNELVSYGVKCMARRGYLKGKIQYVNLVYH